MEILTAQQKQVIHLGTHFGKGWKWIPFDRHSKLIDFLCNQVYAICMGRLNIKRCYHCPKCILKLSISIVFTAELLPNELLSISFNFLIQALVKSKIIIVQSARWEDVKGFSRSLLLEWWPWSVINARLLSNLLLNNKSFSDGFRLPTIRF